MTEPETTDPALLRKGRRLAFALFYGFVIVFVAIPTAEISWQVLATHGTEPIDCRTGLRSLAGAVDDARAASERVETSPEDALARFRAALQPAWNDRDRVDLACKKDEKLSAAFDTIERLRYAEENSVRRDARDLAPLRRKVHDLLANELAR